MTITNGYCTLADFKLQKRVSSSNAYDDTSIEAIIESAARDVDVLTATCFYARSETRYFAVPEGRELCLDDYLITVSTLTNGDGTVLTTADYNLWPRNSSPKTKIILNATGGVSWLPSTSTNSDYPISLVATWGYAAAAPVNIKQLCLELAVLKYEQREGQQNTTNTTTIMLPSGVLSAPAGFPARMADVTSYYRRHL